MDDAFAIFASCGSAPAAPSPAPSVQAPAASSASTYGSPHVGGSSAGGAHYREPSAAVDGTFSSQPYTSPFSDDSGGEEDGLTAILTAHAKNFSAIRGLDHTAMRPAKTSQGKRPRAGRCGAASASTASFSRWRSSDARTSCSSATAAGGPSTARGHASPGGGGERGGGAADTHDSGVVDMDAEESEEEEEPLGGNVSECYEEEDDAEVEADDPLDGWPKLTSDACDPDAVPLLLGARPRHSGDASVYGPSIEVPAAINRRLRFYQRGGVEFFWRQFGAREPTIKHSSLT